MRRNCSILQGRYIYSLSLSLLLSHPSFLPFSITLSSPSPSLSLTPRSLPTALSFSLSLPRLPQFNSYHLYCTIKKSVRYMKSCLVENKFYWFINYQLLQFFADIKRSINLKIIKIRVCITLVTIFLLNTIRLECIYSS